MKDYNPITPLLFGAALALTLRLIHGDDTQNIAHMLALMALVQAFTIRLYLEEEEDEA